MKVCIRQEEPEVFSLPHYSQLNIQNSQIKYAKYLYTNN